MAGTATHLPNPAGKASNLGVLARQITPEMFRPDGNLNAHEIPIALQLPDWNQWLPRVHPKDAWGPAFSQSEFAALYDGETPEGKSKRGKKLPLRTLLASAQTTSHDLRPVVAAFAQWSEARRSFLGRYGKAEAASPELSNKVYSAQLWQLVKTWEMMQEFGLEGTRARPLWRDRGFPHLVQHGPRRRCSGRCPHPQRTGRRGRKRVDQRISHRGLV